MNCLFIFSLAIVPKWGAFMLSFLNEVTTDDLTCTSWWFARLCKSNHYCTFGRDRVKGLPKVSSKWLKEGTVQKFATFTFHCGLNLSISLPISGLHDGYMETSLKITFWYSVYFGKLEIKYNIVCVFLFFSFFIFLFFFFYRADP